MNRMWNSRQASAAGHRPWFFMTAAVVLLGVMNALAGDNSVAVETTNTLANYTLDYSTPCDPILQARLEA
ncbi:MAG: hypothetical protein NT154_06180, partial [Verrucomicrobia bacterium]|nr:hypothetical protein [Verrucomicrobiota bacterium]